MVETEVTPPQPKRARPSWTRRVRRRLARPVARWIAPVLWRTYALSWRKRIQYASPESEAGLRDGGVLALLWHGRGACTVPLFRGTRAAILVSLSRDGQVMEELLKGFGFEVIQGSSSKGGTKAIRSLRQTLAEGRTIGISPDGPRGPQHSVAQSVPYLARATGAPVICVGVAATRAWRLHNWDRYTIPKPFSKVAAFVSEPLRVPRHSDGEDDWAETIRGALMNAEQRAAEMLDQEPDP